MFDIEPFELTGVNFAIKDFDKIDVLPRTLKKKNLTIPPQTSIRHQIDSPLLVTPFPGKYLTLNLLEKQREKNAAKNIMLQRGLLTNNFAFLVFLHIYTNIYPRNIPAWSRCARTQREQTIIMITNEQCGAMQQSKKIIITIICIRRRFELNQTFLPSTSASTFVHVEKFK